MKFIETYNGLYIAPSNEYGYGYFISQDGLTSRLVTRNDLFQSIICDVEEKLFNEVMLL